MVSWEEFRDVSLTVGKFLIFANYYWILSIVDFFRQFLYPKKKSVENDIVLITGGAGGLGHLLCKEFLDLGARVVILDLNDEAMVSMKSQMYKKTGKSIHCYNCDISSRQNVLDCAERVKKDVGPVSILINNAAIVIGQKIWDYSQKEIEKSFAINTFAHYWTIQAFLPDMIKRKHGHIVAVSSQAAYFGLVGLSEYCASKAGVSIMMECLSREIYRLGLDDHIHTTCLSPFFIQTDMFKNCKLRFSKLIPSLETDYCVKRMMQAILSNQRVLMIPRSMYFFIILGGIQPQRYAIEWDELLGKNEFMDDFHTPDQNN